MMKKMQQPREKNSIFKTMGVYLKKEVVEGSGSHEMDRHAKKRVQRNG